LAMRKKQELANKPKVVVEEGPFVHPGDKDTGPFFHPAAADPVDEAKNIILGAFRDFYTVQKPPAPNTLAALNYVPWKPERSLLQYTQASIQDFKPIIDSANVPFSMFDFKVFAGLMSSQLGLLVPVVRVIRMDTMRFRPFLSFPEDVKMFVNAALKFVEVMRVVKRKAHPHSDDPDMLRATNSQQDLIRTLRVVLGTLRQILVAESQPVGISTSV